ncbi:Oidioi.mRNA.OKI2018_I69.chr2.g6787.t1.cds [Oikopleura dioica]|uniref:Oidioi.mRNA.OKI2018_I69.chr2.g6787.t1.cds n=1 Tax=Oikopleura dioica TaxID=34765 RepID=A0ABN7T7X2_OIKDI|nr:Oidioi.mRNA.OKI2018_I69.chr2.g6787.t1.cds [Oikopleura dioica]
MKTDSPHSGLRLLSEAISPHMRELAKKEEEQLIAESLSRESVIKETPKEQVEQRNVGKRKLFEAELMSEGSSQGSNQDEKEASLTRSLDKIVERFLERFSDKENEQFTLMDLEFTAVKRRIYDVINVLEGVGYIQKWQKKNSYLWTSKATMEEKILKIRRSANVDSQNQDLVATIAHSIVAKDETFDDLTSHSDNSHLEASDSSLLNISELSNSSLDSSSFSSSCSKSSSMTKNLSNLTVRFISLFFRISPVNWTLTLDEAAERLVADSGELDLTAASKSRIASIKRRLYDITNVFLALGLIEKVQVTYGAGVHLQRKSAYHWIGATSVSSADKTGSNSTSKTVLEDVTHLQQKNSIDRQCQTSPSLLRSLIADIHAELDEARAHDSISLSLNCPTCLNQLHRQMPALCPHCRSHLPAATNAALSESSNSLLSTKQKLLFSPLPSSPIASSDGPCRRQLTSTPLAGVSKIASNFCKLSSATLSSGTFAANRKRKSSAPVFSTRMPPNFNNPNAAIPRSSFMSTLVTNKKPLASKTLNFASPIAPNHEINRQRKPSRNGANVHFLLPMEVHLPSSPKRIKDDSGLGPSPSLLPPNALNPAKPT